jgi:TPR repeat protein
MLLVPTLGHAQARVKFLKHSDYAGVILDGREVDRADLQDARHLARLGDRQAQFNTGAMYHALGKYDGAIYWYRRAALFRHPLAAYNLGLLFYEGRHVAHDMDKALRWLEVAAQAGYPQAQLAYMTYRGEIPGAGRAEEADWYREAAFADDAVAQYNLGVMLWQGDGIERDPVEGFAWLSLAAPEVDRAEVLDDLEASLSDREREEALALRDALEEDIRPFVMR